MMAVTSTMTPRNSGLTVRTDIGDCDSFPAYVDPFDSSDDTVGDSDDVATMASSPDSVPPTHKLVEAIREDPSRHASPQPTQVSAHPITKNNGNGYRVLRSATVGYIAPEFKEKADQIKQGKQPFLIHTYTHKQKYTFPTF